MNAELPTSDVTTTDAAIGTDRPTAMELLARPFYLQFPFQQGITVLNMLIAKTGWRPFSHPTVRELLRDEKAEGGLHTQTWNALEALRHRIPAEEGEDTSKVLCCLVIHNAIMDNGEQLALFALSIPYRLVYGMVWLFVGNGEADQLVELFRTCPAQAVRELSDAIDPRLHKQAPWPEPSGFHAWKLAFPKGTARPYPDDLHEGCELVT